MGLAHVLVVLSTVTATTTIACGSLLGFGEDDPAPAPPPPSQDSGDGVLDAQTIEAAVEDAATDAPIDAGIDGAKIVFLSSQRAAAAFDGGAAGADAFCDSLAKAAGITGRSFVAYLFLDALLVGGSHTGTSLEAQAGWFLPNGKRAFPAGFLGPVPTPETSLAVDEHGADLDASAGAWIGSAGGLLGTGLFGANTCSEWTATSGLTRIGDPAIVAQWRASGDRFCDGQRHVYCFER